MHEHYHVSTFHFVYDAKFMTIKAVKFKSYSYVLSTGLLRVLLSIMGNVYVCALSSTVESHTVVQSVTRAHGE